MRSRRLWPLLLAGAAFFSVFKAHRSFYGGELRVLFNSTAPLSDYEITSPAYSQDYFFLENVFSPLVEYSSGDEIVSGLAESYRWDGGDAVFRMRTGVRTIDGRVIDARDAELSLKRAFILGGRDFDVLRVPLCGPRPLRSLSDPCPGLKVLDGGQVLVMGFGEKKPLLFHLLTNITYGVVPRGALDPVTLKIKDYRNTSGPYYVASDLGGGAFVLAANPGHYRYSERMPLRVRLVPLTKVITNEEALAMLSEGKVDYIVNNLVRNPADKLRFAAAMPGYSASLTQPIRLVYLVFTKKGIERLSMAERFFIARKARELYLSGRELCEAPYQIFRMEGALSKAQLSEIKDRLEGASEYVIKRRLSALWTKMYFFRKEDDFGAWLPGLSDAADGKTELDFFFNSGDVGFQDDIGLLSYYLKRRFFDMTEEEKDGFFRKYESLKDKKERALLLRDLQYRAISRGRVLPVALMPYSSLARAPWKFQFPSMCAGDNLWRLRRD